MSVDPAFKSLPKSQTCFNIWRIEKFSPIPVPKDQYGSFYDGDSYLVLAARESKGGALDVRIHFWLGENTSQDEAGTVAIKAVELDDCYGGAPIQHREVQGHESKTFLNYFKSKGGLRYMQGGAASGFTHVEHVTKRRLMHVKGKHLPRIKEIPIGWDHMNEGDSYILDQGKIIVVWNGKSCSRKERLRAMEHAHKLRDERGGGYVCVCEQEEEDQMPDDEKEMFYEVLPLENRSLLKPASAGGEDASYERKAAADLKLWKVAEEGSSLKITEVSAKPLTKDMLDTNDCFIVDNGEAGIWAWCGRKSSPKEKKEAMANATAFIKQRSYPNSVPVAKVHEMGEPADFKALFKVWEKLKVPGQTKVYNQNKIARTVQTKFDAATLHENPEVAKETGMVDDGSGSKKIWRIERQGNTYELVELEKKYVGQLFGGDSYVILYTYLVNGKENYIVYYWLGRKSTQDERGVAAKKAVEVDDSLNGAAVQVRVTHGKESNHFLAMFGGKLIIFEGGKAGWGQNQDEGPGDTYLLHVRGTSAYNTKAEQVPLRAESLNSNDVFVLFSKSGCYVWAGKGCTGDEREMAKAIAGISPRGYTLIVEGQEKEDFWNLLGGKGEYSTSPRLQSADVEDLPERLFQCSNASGQFKVDEITEFSQEDLITDDVFMLDAGDTLYLWVGDDARADEKENAMETASEYIETDPAGRDKDIPILMVKQGYEPITFVGYFGVWDRDLWSGGKSYEELKAEMGEKNLGMERVRAKSGSTGEAPFSDVAKYPLDTLKHRDTLPDGVDPQHKEKHLSDEEFQKVFNTSYAEFIVLPQWKQTQLKKDKNLF